MKKKMPQQNCMRRKIVLGSLCLPAMGLFGTQVRMPAWANQPQDTLWKPPALVQLDYDMQGEWAGSSISGNGTIDWVYDATPHTYVLELNISA